MGLALSVIPFAFSDKRMIEMHITIISPIPAVRAGLRALLAVSLIDSYLATDAHQSLVISDSESLAQALDILDEVDLLIWSGKALPIQELSQLTHHQAGRLAVLTLVDDPLLAQGLPDLALRSWGVLPLDCSGDELTAAVNALAEGLIVGEPAMLRQILKPQNQSQPMLVSGQEEDVVPLTEREIEILQLIAQGLPNKQIASRLAISEHTVKFHISSIYVKLNVSNRTEAVRRGIQSGLIVF